MTDICIIKFDAKIASCCVRISYYCLLGTHDEMEIILIFGVVAVFLCTNTSPAEHFRCSEPLLAVVTTADTGENVVFFANPAKKWSRY